MKTIPSNRTTNQLFEASRMLLPEHRAALIKSDFARYERKQKELDDQEWDRITDLMLRAYHERRSICIGLFHPIEELHVVGIIDRIDRLTKRFMVDGEWFAINDIETIALERY